jgi:alpha-tubulin suppressor-like RCC1 family protein
MKKPSWYCFILAIFLYGLGWVTGANAVTPQIAAGRYHMAMVRSDGTLWTWGYNVNGELGDGTTTNKSSPIQVGTDTNWTAVSAMYHYTVALKSDGTLWAWGYNAVGQLGDGTTTIRKTPVRVGTATNWAKVAAGAVHTVALKSDGTLWTWGDNSSGQLGDGTTTGITSPIQVGAGTNWVAVDAGYDHTVALKSDGTLWAWGSNSYGALGDGTTTIRKSPVQALGGPNWRTITAGDYYTAARRVDGTLWAWGYNSEGQLGDGTSTDRNSPVQVGVDHNWVSAAAGAGSWGSHTAALRSDGTLWTWGDNGSGELGDGTNMSSYFQGQVGSDTDWKAVSVGRGSTIALKSGNDVWAWGYNLYGQVGDGTTTSRNTPQRVKFPFFLSGVVNQFATGQGIPDARVTVKDQNNNVVGIVTTDQAGNFSYQVGDTGYFTVSATKAGYEMKSTPQVVEVTALATVPATIYLAPGAPTHFLTLSQGWNFISTTVQPDITMIDQVLADVAPNIKVVWAYDGETQTWLRYVPGDASSDLSSIDSGRGYWVYSTSSADLVISGSRGSSKVPLSEGWNLVGYNGADGTPVGTGLISLGEKWSILWGWSNGTWSVKDRLSIIGGLTAVVDFKVGRAYWIKINPGQAGDGWAQ